MIKTINYRQENEPFDWVKTDIPLYAISDTHVNQFLEAEATACKYSYIISIQQSTRKDRADV